MYCIAGKKTVMLGIVMAVCLIGALAGGSMFGRTSWKQIPVQGQPVAPVELPVLMYHGFTEKAALQGEFRLSPEVLEEDLKTIEREGYTTILPSELIDYFDGKGTLPEKPIMLTFDDGSLDNYVYAFPLLKKYRCKAVISPIGQAADKAEEEQYRSVDWSQCTWAQLREMQRSGLIEIQNHTYDLHHIRAGCQGVQAQKGEAVQAYRQRLTEDLRKAEKRITEEIGIRPTVMVYPFGAVSPETEEIVRSMGYRAAFDCENKINFLTCTEELYHIHRQKRTAAPFLELFQKGAK